MQQQTDLPLDLKYTESHEWLQQQANSDVVTIGITAYAVEQLGDLVFVELPEIGNQYTSKDPCCVVESVKAASDVYAPVSGKIVAVNTDLATNPALLNQDPYANWLFKLQVNNATEIKQLLSNEHYKLLLS